MTAPAPAPAKRRKFPWWIYWLVFGFVLLFMIFPIIPVSLAEQAAKDHGCALTEGYVSPCIVDGKDIGQDIHTLGMMGWLFLATGPVGTLALGLWLIVLIVHRILWGRGNRQQAMSA